MTRELAWKPRCAVIMLVNAWARSTLDISTVPAVVKPAVALGVLTTGVPEFGDASQRFEPERWRPAALENVASDRKPADCRVPRAVDVADLAVLGDRHVRRARRDVDQRVGAAGRAALDVVAVLGDQVAGAVGGEVARTGVLGAARVGRRRRRGARATRNMPGPCEIATSYGLPVDCSEPPVIRLSIEPSCVPRPI